MSEYSDNAIICPYCKHENSSEEFYETHPTEMECEECGKEFDAYVEYVSTYYSDKKETKP